MIKKIAYLFNRTIKNPTIYNYLSKIYYIILNMQKFFQYGTTNMFNEICIETTSLCNRKCSYCPVSKFDRGKNFMSKKLFQKIIAQLVDMKFKGDIHHHFFAEPLLDKRLEDFVAYEKSRLPYCPVTIYTNGDLLTKKRFQSLKKSGVDYFFITLHYENPNKNFTRFYRSLDKKSKKRIVIRKLSPASLLVTRGGLVKVKNKEIKKFCGFPSNNLVIDTHGNVALCCEDYFAKYKWGNVKKETIINIWNKTAFKKLRNQTMKGDFSLPLCEHCTNADL